MARALMLLLSVVACAAINSAALAAPEPCKDCDPATGLTIREQIRAERARDADRVAKESASRPWDGKDIGDIGQAKPTNSPPVVR